MEGYDKNGNPLIQGVVSATAVLTAVGSLGEKSSLAQKLEAAMTQAVVNAAEQGLTDPAVIKELMMVARQHVLDKGEK